MSTSRKLSPAGWCGSFSAIVVVVSGAIAFANFKLDFYGLFGDARGRSLKFYSNERTSKYLYGFNYIPSNFDGLLIGSSASVNWNPKAIKGYRIYNASIVGGNISEEKLVADNVFARGRMHIVLFCIHPYLTTDHGRKSGYMNPREYLGALGSIQLFTEYGTLLWTRVTRQNPRYDENGWNDFQGEPGKAARFRARYARDTANHGIQPGKWTAYGYPLDETALLEYGRVVESARATGARIVAFVPPFFSDRYEPFKADYDAYVAKISRLFLPGEQIINFNDGRHSSFTKDWKNYLDGSHLTVAAAAYFSAQLNDSISADRNRTPP